MSYYSLQKKIELGDSYLSTDFGWATKWNVVTVCPFVFSFNNYWRNIQYLLDTDLSASGPSGS